MFNRLEIFQMAHGLATHAASRQARVAGNVANADTPGYHATDITPFAESYRANSNDTGMRQTRAGHAMTQHDSAADWKVVDRPGESSPNGNTVSLETEIMKATEVRHAHEMALAVYKSSLGILRTSIGRG